MKRNKQPWPRNPKTGGGLAVQVRALGCCGLLGGSLKGRPWRVCGGSSPFSQDGGQVWILGLGPSGEYDGHSDLGKVVGVCTTSRPFLKISSGCLGLYLGAHMYHLGTFHL